MEERKFYVETENYCGIFKEEPQKINGEYVVISRLATKEDIKWCLSQGFEL